MKTAFIIPNDWDNLVPLKEYNVIVDGLRHMGELSIKMYLKDLSPNDLDLNPDLSKWTKQDWVYFAYEVVNEDCHNFHIYNAEASSDFDY